MLTERERATLERLVETFAPPQTDIGTAARAVETAISRLAPQQQGRLRLLLQLLDGPALALLLIRRPKPFSALRQAEREGLLRALAHSRVPALRSGFQALKRLCHFMAYAAVDQRGGNPLWSVIGYPGPRADFGAREAPLPMFTPEPNELEVDAVVIGSGAGGSVAAALLAFSGRRTIVLEAGPNSDPAQFNQCEAEMMGRWYLDSALAASEDLGVTILAGACVGGGTVVNWCTALPLEPAIGAQWSQASGGIDFEASLAPHYAAVMTRLGAARITAHNANNTVLLRGCAHLGWHADAAQRSAAGCADGCGYCGLGCAYGCKGSTPSTYLRDAVAAGANIVAGARVSRILIENGQARGVEAELALTDSRRSIRVNAPLVIVAAGALRSPGLLRRSGVRSLPLGRHLRLHPTTALLATFDEPIETWRGPMQSAYSNHFGNLHDGYGAKLEAAPAHPGLAALALPWIDRAQHAEQMRAIRNAAALIVLTRDRGEGVVGLDESATVSYRLASYDAYHMRKALAGLAEIALAAGARRLITLHQPPLKLDAAGADSRARRAFASAIMRANCGPNRLGVFSAHQMGTCRMHSSPRGGAVDEFGAVHGVRGVIVADASVFPLASGVNPMITIMALAHRSIAHQLG